MILRRKLLNIFMLSFLAFGFPCLAQETAATTPTSASERFVEIESIKGIVQIKNSPLEDWSYVQPGTHLKQNGEIKTSKDSTAVLLIDEKGATGKVELSPGTWMRIADLSYIEGPDQNKKTLLDLALGQILVQAEKLKGASSFQVRTPTSTTSVRGTVFEVKVSEEESHA